MHAFRSYDFKDVCAKITRSVQANLNYRGNLADSSLSAVTHAPFHASVPRPAKAGPMHESAGVGEVIECCAALIN